MMGWFSREARSWTRTNPLAAIGRAHAGKPMTMKQMVKKMGAGQARAPSHLQRAYNTIRKLRAEIRQLKNQIQQLKKINRAQAPMADSGVNIGTYRLYQQGYKRIIAITMVRQRLSTYTMPQIRAVCDEMLGLSNPTEFKGYGRGRGK